VSSSRNSMKHASESEHALLLQVSILDPQAELETPKVDVRLSNGSDTTTASLCCPVCRRPCVLELKSETGQINNCSKILTTRLRNAHDTTACWAPVCHADIKLPGHGAKSHTFFLCPHCSQEVTVELRQGIGNIESDGRNVATDGNGGRDFAYATLLYGSSVDYFIGALVLGWTLARPVLEPELKPRYRRVLLHTQDVPSEYLQALSHFWELRIVDYLTGSTAMYHDYNGSRFKEVFTKLQAVNQVDLEKVLMLDNDLIVRRNIDHLFDLPAPAALKRPGGRDQPLHGAGFRASVLWGWRRLEKDDVARSSDVGGWRYDMMSGINAGVMLLHPDRVVYKRMLAEIADNNHPEHLNCYGPEQEYIGRFYSAFGRGWTHMDARFNYQPLLGRGANRFMRELDAAREVSIAHFSGPRVKPWVGLVARHERLDAKSFESLLHESSDAFATRFPENPRLPPTGAERYGEQGFPPLIVLLVREWAEQLRDLVRHLKDQTGLELVAVVKDVTQKQQGLCIRLQQVLLFLRRLFPGKVHFIALLIFLLSLTRFIGARKLSLRAA